MSPHFFLLECAYSLINCEINPCHCLKRQTGQGKRKTTHKLASLSYGNKGRLPASGLGAKCPEQHALAHCTDIFAQSVTLFTLFITCLFSSSRSHPIPRPAQLFSRSLVLPLTTRVDLSLPLRVLVLFISEISCGLIHPPPAAPLTPGPYSISSSSASSSPSAKILLAVQSSPPFSVADNAGSFLIIRLISVSKIQLLVFDSDALALVRVVRNPLDFGLTQAVQGVEGLYCWLYPL
jgi:hypothetical protein